MLDADDATLAQLLRTAQVSILRGLRDADVKDELRHCREAPWISSNGLSEAYVSSDIFVEDKFGADVLRALLTHEPNSCASLPPLSGKMSLIEKPDP
mmetsp:Transcript_7241/g.10800  ORF Transcript_7241/g.10800 Transcript_7241/m.10800 type:complete len:97 (+) Transcript_7241:1125-1415(+)